ncbi:MAG TPA: cyclodeaminase/cyclohydrolase family protein, partial [Anaerolineales bacterium]
LIPQEALVDAAVWHLQLDQFEPAQILEQRLYAAQQETAEVSSVDFLDQLAAGTAAPGGGSASAYSGAAGAALVAMVARLTIGKKKYAAVEAQMQSVLERADGLRRELTSEIQRDAAAFEAVMAAFKLPKETPEQQDARARAVEQATLQASRVPLEVAGKSVEVLELASQVVALGNVNAISDGATAAALARAALAGAGYNVRINIGNLQDQAAAQPLLDRLIELERRATQIEDQVRNDLHNRGGMPLE